jgi:hypothetical protein
VCLRVKMSATSQSGPVDTTVFIRGSFEQRERPLDAWGVFSCVGRRRVINFIQRPLPNMQEFVTSELNLI